MQLDERDISLKRCTVLVVRPCIIYSVMMASGLHSSDVDWQTTRTLAQCNKYMLENQVQCDVTFRVGEAGATEDIQAHR